MRHSIKAAVLVSALAACSSHAAVADDQSRISYFPVGGSSAREVYESIRQSSPKIAPNATFAFTAIATKTDSKTRLAGGVCTYRAFRTRGFYIYYLPRHSSPSQMAAGLHAKWREFARYLLTHEQGHRKIWQDCLAGYDRQAARLVASDCKSLEKARERAFEKVKRACVRKDEAYDFAFRKEVRQQPFVVEALAQ